jgi:hypothetical protein
MAHQTRQIFFPTPELENRKRWVSTVSVNEQLGGRKWLNFMAYVVRNAALKRP